MQIVILKNIRTEFKSCHLWISSFAPCSCMLVQSELQLIFANLTIRQPLIYQTFKSVGICQMKMFDAENDLPTTVEFTKLTDLPDNNRSPRWKAQSWQTVCNSYGWQMSLTFCSCQVQDMAQHSAVGKSSWFHDIHMSLKSIYLNQSHPYLRLPLIFFSCGCNFLISGKCIWLVQQLFQVGGRKDIAEDELCSFTIHCTARCCCMHCIHSMLRPACWNSFVEFHCVLETSWRTKLILEYIGHDQGHVLLRKFSAFASLWMHLCKNFSAQHGR